MLPKPWPQVTPLFYCLCSSLENHLTEQRGLGNSEWCVVEGYHWDAFHHWVVRTLISQSSERCRVRLLFSQTWIPRLMWMHLHQETHSWRGKNVKMKNCEIVKYILERDSTRGPDPPSIYLVKWSMIQRWRSPEQRLSHSHQISSGSRGTSWTATTARCTPSPASSSGTVLRRMMNILVIVITTMMEIAQ